MVNKVKAQTNSRFAAENSLRSAMTYLLVVASTHFVVGNNNDMTTQLPRATKGARKLAQMITDYYGSDVPIFPVHPALLLSTDDSTLFVFRGKVKKDSGWYLHEAGRNTSVLSTYSTDVGGSSNLNGLRVRLTHTMSGLGIMAPLYITVYGLTERELSPQEYPTGILVVRVPGLCYAGHMDVRVKEVGFLVFTRSAAHEAGANVSSSTMNFSYYRKHVLLPFIRNVRKILSSSGTDSKSEINDKLTCVSWVDGGMTQLQSIVDSNQQALEEKLKVFTCKQSASRTAVEQACDVSPVFRSINALQKSISMEDLPPGGSLLDCKVRECLGKVKSGLHLKSQKLNSIIELCVCLPGIIAKAAPAPHTVAQGFLHNGMLDATSHCYPDFDKILHTVKRKLSSDELLLCENSFPKLFHHQLTYGYVKDELLNELGFPHDTDVEGNITHRTAGISQESLQRAKVLSHKYQKSLREDRIAECIEKKALIEEERINKCKVIWNGNIMCQDILSQELGETNLDCFGTCTLKMFAKCKMNILKHFVYVRRYKGVVKDKNDGFSFPIKKGTCEITSRGEVNMVKLAYDHRLMPVIMEAPNN